MVSSVSVCELVGLPLQVAQATRIDWGVTIDAYLSDAAWVGCRLTALVYCDLSGASNDGMTVVTPEVRTVGQKGGYRLVQSMTGHDHYVIVSELQEAASAEG